MMQPSEVGLERGTPPAPAPAPASRAPGRLASLLRSAGARDSVVLGAAMGIAGVLDYVVNVVAGRWLEPAQFGVFIAITAVVQVLTLLSIAIRMVVALHVAAEAVHGPASPGVARFAKSAWAWAWMWGLVGTGAFVVAGPLLAGTIHLRGPGAVWAASGMVLMLFLREALYGVLQGLQSFARLGIAQLSVALLRLTLASAAVAAGLDAAGAIVAQPLASVGGVALMAWWVRPWRGRAAASAGRAPGWRYSTSTVVGLAMFGLLSNADALFVGHFHGPKVIAAYAPVVTLAKLSLFLPWAIGLVLFPKVAQRRACGLDARPLLLAALAAALAPGLVVSGVYFAAPGLVVRTVFGAAYADPGPVLGLASVAATSYAGLHIWLNYALSLERKAYVRALVAVASFQAAGMFLLGRESLVGMTLAMVASGVAANIAGWWTTRDPGAADALRAVALGG